MINIAKYDVYKVAALVVRRKKLLMVRKTKKDPFINLGGKKKKGESNLECLLREVNEELCCGVKDIKYFHSYDGKTHDGENKIRIACYLCELDGRPRINPDDAINSYAWIPANYKNYGFEIAPITKKYIIPALVKKGLL